MKQRVTSQDITCLVPALNQLLDGSYLVQVYDGCLDNTKTIILKLRNKVDGINVVYYLLLESGIRVHTIDNFTSIRKMPSGCVGKLRKEFGEKRLYPIKQIGTDRSLDFTFSNEKHLIVEFYDRGNFIITDNDYKIIYISRPYQLNDYKVEVNEIYPIEFISQSGPSFTKNLDDAKGYVVDKCNFGGFPLDNTKKMIQFPDINAAMKHYFWKTLLPITNKTKNKTTNKPKMNKKMNIQGQIDKFTKNEQKYLEKIEFLQDYIDELQHILNMVNTSSNETICQAYNQYNIKINYNNVLINDIELDFTKSVYINIGNMYSQIKKIQLKKNRAIEIYQQTNDTDKPNNKLTKIEVNRKTMKFENYWWFISNGFTILCGKNADDNEFILSNVEPDDILVHGHFDKSPWAVIKNPNKLEIPLKVIDYTGSFVVQRSWNWIENYSNNSYYTFPNQISKSAPSGEFIGKGARMVHQKNFLSNANLEMGVGVLFKTKDNTYISKLDINTNIEFAMVTCAPYLSMVEYDYKVKIKPSGKKNDKGRKKLITNIIGKILKMKTSLSISKLYIKAIPYDEWDKIIIRSFIIS